MTLQDERSRLAKLLAQRSARRGTFVLSSGRTSDLYVDARLTTMSPDGLSLIGPLARRIIEEIFGAVDSIGGLTLGADPIAYAIAYASAATEHPLRAFTVRKTPKAHGTGQQIEGPYRTGDRVVVIEDVVTTGASALQAAQVLGEAGATICGILALVDRDEGGREALESEGYKVHALVTRAGLLQYLS
jgi:orotate phosphoribosyltransferase